MSGVPYKLWGQAGNRQVIRFAPEGKDLLMIKDSDGGRIFVELEEVHSLISSILEFTDKHITFSWEGED